ncbi:MAG: branched-chain amino acid transaminase [Gaiellales bacterium]
MEPTSKIWMDGELVDWGDATVHVGSHALHYGSGVFEGIRAYETSRGPAVFRLTDHMRRLHRSARLVHMAIPYSVEELVEATHSLVRANGLASVYIRPIAFYGYGTLGVRPGTNPVNVAIISWPWGAYLGPEALEKGIRAKISSWRRVGPNTIPHAAKATGVYLNSMLAVMEAARAGYDEAILLTEDGHVGDGSGENVFVVKSGVLHTPDLAASILPGLTRSTVVAIAETLGHEVRETALIRTDLYGADEVFMTGTAAEVTPIRSIDDIEIGGPGQVTRDIQRAYLDLVAGRDGRWPEWLEYSALDASPGSGEGRSPVEADA